MTWKSEAREVKQAKYGGYVSMCRKLKIEPLTYTVFTLEDHDKTKALVKANKL